MICAGCGLELPPGLARGRPARFHNATCRQRAHRARLSSKHTDVLAALGTVEAAVSEVRRSVLADDGKPAEAGRKLEQAVFDLVRQLRVTAAGATVDDDTNATASTVTEPVTVPASLAGSPSAAASEPEQPGPTPNSVTKAVTKNGRGGSRRTSRRKPPLDLDTVRMERMTDPVNPGWRVLAGGTDDPIVVGTLEPSYSMNGRRSGRWQARTVYSTPLTGGPWRTRADALVRLVDSYQRSAGA